jgi:hypothetical protein
MRLFRIVVLVGLLASVAPLLAMVAAGLTADHFGCRLHEGFVNPCVIGGRDYGETLYNMAMMGWLMLFTLPYGVGLLLVWAVTEIVRLVRLRRQV